MTHPVQPFEPRLCVDPELTADKRAIDEAVLNMPCVACGRPRRECIDDMCPDVAAATVRCAERDMRK